MITFDAIFAQPPDGYWLSKIDFFRAQLGEVRPTGQDLDRIIRLAVTEAQLGHRGRFTNWLSLGLLLDAERSVARLKRSGALRASKYDFHVGTIQGAVRAVLKASRILDLPSGVVRYLASIDGLLTIAKNIARLRSDLVQNLRESAHIALKSLVITIDRLFGSEFVPDRHASTEEWRHYFREELAEAVSYCLYLFNKTVGISAAHFSFVDDRGVLEGRWMPLLVRAAKIRAYMEWEVLVDSDLYIVDQVASRRFTLRPLDPRTEMSIRLGYITAQMAELKEIIADKGVEAVDQAQVAEYLHRILKERDFITTVDKPIRRIVMKFPLAEELREFLSEARFFREEGSYLKSVTRSYLLGFEGFLKQKITGSATLWDFILAWRLLNLLRLTFYQELKEQVKQDPELVVRSQLPVFRIEDLKSLIGLLVAAEPCEDIFQLLRWTPIDDKQIVDLQYRPFITAEGYCLVPLNVAGQSNFIRNALYLSGTRPQEGQIVDPVEKVVELIFQGIGASTASRIVYDFQGQQGEIDVLAYLNGVLFVFECKNSLHPVSPFEFRTTLDHVEKGAAQLTRVCRLSKDHAFLAYLGRRSKLPITESVRIVTCIVTGNRMMSGAVIDGHPVRGLFEFGGFLSTGGIEILGQHVHLVDSERVGADDVVKYLLEDTVHKGLFGSMVPINTVFIFGNTHVSLESYVLSGQKLAETFGISTVPNKG